MRAFFADLTTQNWLTIAAIFVAIVFGSFAAANYLAGRRERKHKSYEATPDIRATINRQAYVGGWRSVQLHIKAKEGQEQNFKLQQWCIQRAKLLRPWSARLARAENDDYARSVFYPETPVRVLQGRNEKSRQRFSLEFFINFRSETDRGKTAKFKVTFSRLNGERPKTVYVWAEVPKNADAFA